MEESTLHRPLLRNQIVDKSYLSDANLKVNRRECNTTFIKPGLYGKLTTIGLFLMIIVPLEEQSSFLWFTDFTWSIVVFCDDQGNALTLASQGSAIFPVITGPGNVHIYTSASLSVFLSIDFFTHT